MMLASFRLLILGCLAGFCYALLAQALPLLPSLNVLDAITLGFALSLSALIWFVIAALCMAAAGFAIAVLSLFAPLLIGCVWLVRTLVTSSKQPSQRDAINRLYPPPEIGRLVLYE